MSDESVGFSIEQKHGMTVFKNETNMMLEVSVVPVKPKRTYTTLLIIPPGSFKIYDQVPIHLDQISFRLINKHGVS